MKRLNLLFILCCIIPFILLALAIVNYVENDKTKQVELTKYETGEWDPETDSESEKNEIVIMTAHSHGTMLFGFCMFFGVAYTFIIKRLARRFKVDKETFLFKLFYYFSILMTIASWLIMLLDQELFNIVGMPLGNHNFF